MLNRLSALRILNRDAKILVFTRGLRSFSAAILTVSFSIYLSKLGASAVSIGLIFTGILLFAALRSARAQCRDRHCDSHQPIWPWITSCIRNDDGVVLGGSNHVEPSIRRKKTEP